MSQNSTNKLVFRNTMLLVGAKILAIPLSVATNAIVARYVGATDYSYIYLASTFTTFGLLFIVFGQSGALPALVAVERSRAGAFLGTALAWRLAAGVVVYAVLAVASLALGYPLEFHYAFALVYAAALVTALTGAILEAIRGFERTDVDAMVNVGTPFFSAVLIIPVVLLGGGLNAVLALGVGVAGVALVFASRFVKSVGIGKLSATRPVVKLLLTKGYPFLFFSTALALQPLVDASFLAKLAPAEVVGWHAAAGKLVGLIVFPASALITALYPVLCRLHEENKASYAATTRSTLLTSMVLMVPVALCCGLFPQVGVVVFGEKDFGPVAQNLRVLSIHVFLMYLSMPIGSAVLASGRARGWSLIQMICVVISLVLDPILVPWFQTNYHNGGLGICWAAIASEVFMVSFGIWMLPRAVWGLTMVRPVVGALLGGVAMVAVAWVLRDIHWLFVAPLTLVVYSGLLWITGAVGREQVQFFTNAILKRRANAVQIESNRVESNRAESKPS